MSLARRLFAVVVAAVFLVAAGAAGAEAPAPAQPFSFRFASLEEGRAIVGKSDDWVAATSDFQRAATVGAPPPVTRARFLAFSALAVRPWSAPEQARWQKALDAITPRLVALHAALPPVVLLVNTDGRDAANAPYTRANAVMLPTQAMGGDKPGANDDLVLAHELFHVISRMHLELSTRLYELMGFESVAPLRWPDAWLPLRIANPDAPYDRHAMRTRVDGRPVMLMPLLVAKRTDLRPGETFFDVLDVRLLEVTPSPAGATLPVMRAGEPVWHTPASAPEYLARLGGNTDYIFHPEETMADNFALLVTQRRAPNPALLSRIEAVLLAPR